MLLHLRLTRKCSSQSFFLSALLHLLICNLHMMRTVVESLERTHTEKKMTFGKKAVEENHAKAVRLRWSVFLWEPSSFKKLHARKKENVSPGLGLLHDQHGFWPCKKCDLFWKKQVLCTTTTSSIIQYQTQMTYYQKWQYTTWKEKSWKWCHNQTFLWHLYMSQLLKCRNVVQQNWDRME